MISVLEFILAARFEHGYGVLVALLAYALALAGLIAILNSNFFAKWHHKRRLLVWIPNIFLFLYLLVLISVRLAAPDHLASSFPAACAKTTNCCRLTRDNTTNSQAQGLTLPVLATSTDGVIALVEGWVSGFFNAGYLRRAYDNSLYQIRFVSAGFGFPDDFYVNYTCVDGNAVLAIQSESRLGTGDFGVNRERVQNFLSYVAHATVTPGTCT